MTSTLFTHPFADLGTIALGAITGLVFGFLLQKGGVTRHEVIVRQFLFRDFTVLKVMLTAIVVGAIGVWGMLQMGMLEHLHIKSAALAMNAVGGLVFGVGMALLGYCPGTALGAVGQGNRDAIVGVAGMVVGAGVYAEAHPWIAARLSGAADLGKVTLADVTHWSPWWFMGLLAAIAIGLFVWLERREAGAKGA